MSNSKVNLKMDLKDKRMKVLNGDIIYFNTHRLGVVKYLAKYIEIIEIGGDRLFKIDIDSLKEGCIYADTEYVDREGELIYIFGICDIDIAIKSITKYIYE